MVTGATRGIGKATALALAAAGWDVAVTGRTRSEGEGRDDSDTGAGRPLPGSLEETGEGIRAAGSRSLELVADLHDQDSLRAAVARVDAEWGGVDLLVNNAVDTAPGSMVPFTELTVAQLESKLAANAVGSFVMIQAVLPGMLARGGGTIVDVTSHTATADPPGPVGRGGWGVAYASSKAAAHRFAPLLAVELGDQGIRAYNLGLVGHYSGAPPSVPASAIVWMVDHPDRLENGQTVRGLKLALVEGLHPDWREA